MRWNRLAETAKKTLDSRGGTEGLKRDAEQLREIARGQGTAKDKARRAAEALKQTGDRGHGHGHGQDRTDDRPGGAGTR